MADRNIHCTRCSTFLGTIRDAKLKKDLAHVCSDCNTAYKALEMMHKNKSDKPDMNDIFGDTFGEIFGKR